MNTAKKTMSTSSYIVSASNSCCLCQANWSMLCARGRYIHTKQPSRCFVPEDATYILSTSNSLCNCGLLIVDLMRSVANNCT